MFQYVYISSEAFKFSARAIISAERSVNHCVRVDVPTESDPMNGSIDETNVGPWYRDQISNSVGAPGAIRPMSFALGGLLADNQAGGPGHGIDVGTGIRTC